jgi:type IV secretory pathway TrbF-like protein
MAAAIRSSDTFEDQLIRKHDKRLVFIVAGFIALTLIQGYVITILARHPRSNPFVIMVDNKTKEVLDIAHPVESMDDYTPQMVQREIVNFIYNAKVLNDNWDDDTYRINTAFAFARGQAAQTLKAYYMDGVHYPQTAYLKKAITVTFLRLPFRLPPPNTWEVDWMETTRDYGTKLVEVKRWRADLRVTFAAPDTRNLVYNPLGLYFTTMNWEPEVDQ